MNDSSPGMAGSLEPERSLEQQLHELTMVSELIRTLTSTLDLSGILRLVLDRIKTLTHAEALSLLLYDQERDELVFAATETLRENALVGMEVPIGQSIAGWVATTGRSELVTDVSQDPRFCPAVDLVTGFATRSLLAVPLASGDRVIGVIEVANRYGGAEFREEDRVALEKVAAGLRDRITPDAVSRQSEVLQQILATVAATVQSEAASLLLWDAGGHALVFKASRTLEAGIIDGLRLSCDQGIAGWVARHRQALRLDDVASDPRYYAGFEKRTGFIPRNMLCVPIVSKDALLGVIQVMNKLGGGSFAENELTLAQTLADQAAIAIANAILYRQAYLASITDDLTGLGNTRHFNRVLPEILARGGPVSLLVLDLDNFKPVVDTFGHLAGSRTIAHIGKIIGALLRTGDVAARFGGDEFVVILPAADTTAAVQTAEKIRTAIEAWDFLDESINVSGVTASVGVATFPDHAGDAESLFRAADAAMYAVKRGRKNAVGVASGQGAAGEA
ncbi:MAG: diguanylate cyclase [Candidatus Binatia bacterium]